MPVAAQRVDAEVGVQVFGRLCLRDDPLVHPGGLAGAAERGCFTAP